MIALPVYPIFQNLSTQKIMALTKDSIERTIFRVRSKMVRTFKIDSVEDELSVHNIGCSFVSPSEEAQKIISDYVENMVKNITYVLMLFQTNSNHEQNVSLIRHIASLMGYPAEEKVKNLRQIFMHDYHSLESL